MAINRQNRQTINKNSNEMAKGPFAKWRFWRKWRILAKMAEMALNRQNRQTVTKIQMRWQRGPLESGDFGENGVFGENGRNGN